MVDSFGRFIVLENGKKPTDIKDNCFLKMSLCLFNTYNESKDNAHITILGPSLKSGPETRDPRTLRPWGSSTRDPDTQDPGTWDPDTQDPGTWDPDTQNPRTGSLGLGTCNPETQNPESRTLRTELVTQIPSIPTRTTD